MSQFPPIYVKEPAWFGVYENYCAVHAYYRNISFSRRQIPIKIHKDIFDYKGKILFPSGRPWIKPYCIHIVFDPENRWHSYYLQTDAMGNPKHQSYVAARLQILELGIQLGSFDDQ